ncbi:class I SAM-dependent methyltransferase [Pseudodesulfovibrio sediminis]|uniref:SAM-dependent methyltransferase n=1 Tax=Pseudodesulfovibrio sediminis TaxID=2810563 RepID=A0ABM7P7W6_9BACT|nr:class I SAM-dependent methyltransferase [Pseudodesulfovibrio sediminis]BCS89515.1 SAM-dependent methyltransferase [Pseudodesulfovibrio sediminis]
MAQNEHLTMRRQSPGRRKRFTEGMLDTDRILLELNILPGQTLVDAGCGNGYMTRLFSERIGPSGTVHAFDLNEHFINTLCEETTDTNIRAQTCDVTRSTPLRSASVDLLYVSTVIHSLSKEELQGLVREVQRLLYPGGLLAVVEIAKHHTAFGPPLKQRYSPEELQEAIPLDPLDTVPVADHFYLQIFQMPAQ